MGRIGLQNVWVQKIVPVGIVLTMGYLSFASYYSLGYQEIYLHHSPSVAVSLWCLLAIFQALLVIYWTAIVLVGPGRVLPIKPYDLYGTPGEDLSPMPSYFFCDEFGYPIWCSNCRSIKPARANHMKATGTCVPRADHFCIWVGTVIGKDNYILFIKFTMWFLLYFVVTLVYLACFTQSNIARGGDASLMNHNFIVLYIISGFWIIALSALIGSHLYYTLKNMTTIDDLAIKRASRYKRLKKKPADTLKNPQHNYELGIRFINVAKDNLRLVVQCSVFDLFYNFGPKQNFINTFLYRTSTYFPQDDPKRYGWDKFFLSAMVLVVPLIDLVLPRPGPEDVSLSPKFEAYLQEKISNRRCYLPQYAIRKDDDNTSITNS